MKFTTYSLLALALAGPISAATYAGNGAAGFGGSIGNSTLTVTDNGTNIDFSLSSVTPFSGNVLVLYVDSLAGGYGDTSFFTDTADGGRTAISGFNSGNPSRTTATFATGFLADYAITLQPGVFSGTFDLSTPANFGFVQSNGLSGSGTGPFTFSISKSSLGLPTSVAYSFDFIGTLISTSAYRSNETIGTSITVPGTLGDIPNAGFSGSQTFADFNTFAVPEPSAILLSFAGLTLAIRRRR